MNEIANIPTAPCQTLSELIEEYLINRHISKEKYFGDYLVIAKRAWQQLFWNTLNVVKSQWLTIQKGIPYNFISLPRDCVRVFSVSVTDKHNRIQQLYYNDDLNTIPQPVSQTCGCERCDCLGNQDELSSLTYTTTLLFTINGIGYYEKSWEKICSNGDLLQYRQVPTKKYNDFRGNTGDFNNDFNQDFSNENAGSDNFSIVTETFQTKLCTLTTAPCGCPEPTQENAQLIHEFCRCGHRFWNWFRHHDQENLLFENINDNEKGEIKMGECGTKIYYRASRHHNTIHHPYPKYLLLNYQTSGLATEIDGSVSVPEYCILAMMCGIDYRSKMFNNKYTINEKKDAEYRYNDAVNKIISFLNPISINWLQNIADAEIKW